MVTMFKICTDIYFGLCWTNWSAKVSITDEIFAHNTVAKLWFLVTSQTSHCQWVSHSVEIDSFTPKDVIPFVFDAETRKRSKIIFCEVFGGGDENWPNQSSNRELKDRERAFFFLILKLISKFLLTGFVKSIFRFFC